MKLKISDRRKKIINRIYKISLVIIGLVIVLFNDTFGKLEGFVEFIVLYFTLLFITIAYWVFKQIKSIIRLKNEKEKTELLHLKSQVNPHFFFNTLNNLYGLMEKDSKEREMVLKLSDMMRYSIYEGQKDWVTLKEELDYLKNYIELQEIRYHKKSDVQFNSQIENPEARIMPLLFIILVENAFKHGLENLEKDAYIHITSPIRRVIDLINQTIIMKHLHLIDHRRVMMKHNLPGQLLITARAVITNQVIAIAIKRFHIILC